MNKSFDWSFAFGAAAEDVEGRIYILATTQLPIIELSVPNRQIANPVVWGFYIHHNEEWKGQHSKTEEGDSTVRPSITPNRMKKKDFDNWIIADWLGGCWYKW